MGEGYGHSAGSGRCSPARTRARVHTVLTTLRILEAKGYLRHKKATEGRAFVYSPAVSRDEASRSAVRSLLRRFFGDSAEALVLNLLDDEKLEANEIRRIRALLEQTR